MNSSNRPRRERGTPAYTAATRPRPAARSLRGLEWLSARAALASRATRRFTRWWLALGGTATIIALLIPVGAPDPEAEARAVLERRAADTLRLAGALRRAREQSATADSVLATLAAHQRAVAASRPVQRPAPPPDPRVQALEAAIANARRLRTADAYLVLSNDPSVSWGPRMRAIADTLQQAAEFIGLAPDAPETDLAAPRATVSRLGNTIIAIAQYRRDALIAEIGADATTGDEPSMAPAGPDTAAVSAATARSAAWRDSVAAATAAYEAALNAADADASNVRAGATRGTFSPGLVMLAIVLAGFAVRFGVALSREMGAPHLAHVTEAEAAVGAPVLAVVRDPLPDGPMRFRPTGVDPFRVFYLGLTATGTRARTLVVTGSDPLVLGAVGARLAITAAADHRATLVMDVDPELIVLPRMFRAAPEPGYTDAMAGAFAWREVARPAGSSDGLHITLIPPGRERDPVQDTDATAAVRTEFGTFRDKFELTIVVAALRDLPHALALVPNSPVVLCGTLGETDVATFIEEGASVAGATPRLHGVVLWDAPRPNLPSRAELAAHLSRNKGRTPGGSFQAVQKIVGKPFGDTNRPS